MADDGKKAWETIFSDEINSTTLASSPKQTPQPQEVSEAHGLTWFTGEGFNFQVIVRVGHDVSFFTLLGTMTFPLKHDRQKFQSLISRPSAPTKKKVEKVCAGP